MNYELYLDELRDRVKLLMVKKHVTSLNFWAEEQLEGMNQPTVHRIMTGKAKPSLEFIRSILDLYPEVSAEWLLRGNGTMHDATTEKSIDNEAILRNMKLDLETAEKKLARQSEEINDLREIIKKKNKIIEEFIRA